MNHSTRLGVAVLALLAILVSFGLPWLEMTNADVTSITVDGRSAGDSTDFPFPGGSFGTGMTLVADASNGSLSIPGLQLDIWLVIVIAAVGAVLALFASTAPNAMPRFVPTIVLAFAAAFLAGSFIGAIDERLSLQSGVFAASIGVVAALVATLAPRPETEA